MEFGKDIKVVIFDFDGTLFDLDVDWNTVRQKLKVPSDENIGNLIQDYIINNDSRLEIITDAEIRSIAERRLSDDAVKVINHLLKQNVTIGVFSRNSHRAIEIAFKNSRLDQRIKIVGREDVVWQKPKPDGILQLMEQSGVSKAETILVGDTKHDIDSARSAGIRVIIIENKRLDFRPEGSDYYVDNISRLTALQEAAW